MNKAERAMISTVLETVASSRIYGLVGLQIDLALLHPAGGLPIPMGAIDSDGRLSIDALAAHVPSKIANLYARHMAGLLGCSLTGWRDTVLIDAAGNRPSITPLLEDGGWAWGDVLAEHGEHIRHYFEQKAAGLAADGFLVDD